MSWPGPGDSYQGDRDEIDAAIRRVLDSGWYVLGKEVEAFEAEFSTYIGTSDAVGVASGTDAIAIALRACGVGRGDRVATVSHTASATAAAIEMVGADPVFVDVDEVSMVMDLESLARTVEHVGGVRAVVPVHLYGQPVDMPTLVEMARGWDAAVVEDAAQAHGARVAGRRVGSWGDAAAFSCYPTKNLGALGDAGAITTRDELAAQARLIRQYGWRERYISDFPGMNSRLDPLQAAVLRVKLRHLEQDNAQRNIVASWYDELLPEAVTKPQVVGTATHAFHQYVIRVADRDSLVSHLSRDGIPATVLYPRPVHLQPAYRGRLPRDPHGLPVTESVCNSLVCLPTHPMLLRTQVEAVARSVAAWVVQQP
jgi:dTDP-4-amino-4,6-dideoxygalactose transaminase